MQLAAWVFERRKLKRFCNDCKKIFEETPKLKGKGPKCDQCFPGVLLGNVDAWEVFQRYSAPLGADSGVILNLCKVLGVKDPVETLEKVLELLGAMEEKS